MIISNFIKNKFEERRGFTLFIAVVTSSLVLAIGLSILNITLKEFLLSGTLRDSEMAFYAADAGMECALYYDSSSASELVNQFDNDGVLGSVNCMDDSSIVVTATDPSLPPDADDEELGIAQHFEVEWGTNPTLCAKVSVTKSDSTVSGSCPVGVECTQIISRGYNRACDDLASPRTVERALKTTLRI